MSINALPSAVETPAFVIFLMERAERIALDESLTSAKPLFVTAIACDPTPVARIAYAVELAHTDPQAAIAEFEIAWELSRRLKSPPLRANCCRNLAILFRRTGNLATAEQFRQLAISAELESPVHAQGAMISPSLSGEIALGWVSSGELDPALRLFTSSASVASDGDILERALVASYRGVIAILCGQPMTAQEHLLEACRLCQRARDWRGCGNMLVNLGHVCLSRRQYDLARERFHAATQLFELLGDVDAADRARTFEREAAAWNRIKNTNPRWN